MSRAARFLAAAGLAVGFAASPADAVLRRHDRADTLYLETRAYARGVGGLGGATGTLVGDRWVLTAAHVAANLSPFSRSFRIQGQSIPIDAVHTYPGWGTQTSASGVDAIDTDVPDLALVRLARAPRNTKPVALRRTPDEVGRTIVVVGLGLTGTGETGPADEDGRLRAATNVVDGAEGGYFTFSFSPPGDSGVTDREGIGGPGDSGGPAFVQGPRGLEIVGVSSLNSQGAAEGPSRYRSVESYARVATSLAWLDSTMKGRGRPDPVRDRVVDLRRGWPDSRGARLARGWLEAFDARDSLKLVAWEREFRAESLLVKRPAEERATSWRKIRGDWGHLEAAGLVETPGEPLKLLVHAAERGWMRLDFELEKGPAGRIVAMRTNQPEDPPPGRR